MAVRVDGRIFEGCGRSKRLAQAQVAASALQDLFNISLGPETSISHTASWAKSSQLPQVGTLPSLTYCMSSEFNHNPNCFV